jgi:hypothetical protein
MIARRGSMRALVVVGVAAVGMAAFLGCCGQAPPSGQAEVIGTQHTFQSAVVTDTNGTAMWVHYYPLLGVQVEGITTAVVSFQGTIDGSTWYAVEAVNVSTGAVVTSTAADGLFRLPVGDVRQVRCPVSGYSAGTITVVGNAPAAASFGLENPAVAAGEAHVGEVGTPSTVISLTVTVSNTAYASGDLLFETETLTNAVRVTGGTGVIYNITVFDPDDQGAALELYISDTWCTWGTENAAASAADSCVDDVLCGPISVTAADYADVGGSRVAKVAPACLVKAVAGSRDLYITGVSRGTGTYAGGLMVLHVGVLQD